MTAFITANDYPAAALRTSLEGNVGVRLTVSAVGGVSECVVLQTSGSRVLDDAACFLLKRRARFVPALDAEGKPTEGTFDHIVIWKITDEVRRAGR
jgi:TonB family protein